MKSTDFWKFSLLECLQYPTRCRYLKNRAYPRMRPIKGDCVIRINSKASMFARSYVIPAREVKDVVEALKWLIQPRDFPTKYFDLCGNFTLLLMTSTGLVDFIECDYNLPDMKYHYDDSLFALVQHSTKHIAEVISWSKE